MTEPDVALTDFALAIECMAFTWIILSRTGPAGTVKRLFAALFSTIAVGSVLGGISHGFLNSGDSMASRVVWCATLLSLGLTSLVTWFIAAEIRVDRRWLDEVKFGAIVLFAVYAITVLFVIQIFQLAVVNLLPALLFLLFSYIAAYRRQAEMSVLIGISGILVIFVATGLQLMRVAVHPVYFTHNAVYHVLQGLALLMIFNSVAALSKRSEANSG